MNKRWSINPKSDKDLTNTLSEAIEYDSILCNLLIQRGIFNKDDANSFFTPSLKDLHNPFLMKDMDKAVTRLKQGIDNKETILVYGDYDVDGTTSVALIYSFLFKYCSNLLFHIPDRYTEGYGISTHGIDRAHNEGVTLMIVLDCGIKAIEKVEYAKSKNIDIVICDHHTADKQLPDAYAILDPKREDCNYPFKDLSGCGVGFKLLQGYCQKYNISEEEIYPFLDLLCVSIASDIVPIIGENRILAKHGLERLNSNPCIGLKTIKSIANIEKDLTINDIVFKIGPRINAACRIESGKYSVQLLIEKDIDKSKNLGKRINNINDTRKKFDHDITDQARKLLEDDAYSDNSKTTILLNKQWNKGVIAIVASRLIETYYKPTIIFTESDKSTGLITGSARSIDGFDLYNAISHCCEYLENYGGHKYAAGLSLKEENYPLFKEKFNKYVEEHISEETLIPQINIDAEISFNNITNKFFTKLMDFAPFGPKNLNPVFVTKNVVDYGETKAVGRNNEHLKLVITDTPKDTFPIAINGIAFGMGHLAEKIQNGTYFDICYSLQENVFMGKREIQLLIKDIKFHD